MAQLAMKNTTPLFPDFHLQTLRIKPRSASQKLSDEIAKLKQKSFNQLGECFRNFIPDQYLRPSETGALSRRCFFSKENTIWAFFSQVLGDDGGCQEVIRKLQAFAAMKSKPLPSSSTAAYCQARSKLDLSGLEAILQHTSNRLLNTLEPERMDGLRVAVVDGTGVSMSDTIAKTSWCGHSNDIKRQAVVFRKRPFVLDMVRKEIVTHLIAYNCIRYLMVEAAAQAASRYAESVLGQ